MSNTIISQKVAVLCDGNNIERSIHEEAKTKSAMLNFDIIIPRLLNGRGLNRLIYFREGKEISSKLAERLHNNFYGSVVPCHKSADIPLSIKATQLSSKVDTIVIMSGDSDYIDLVRHLRSEGVRVEIAAVKETTARMLVEEVDHFHQITRADWFIYNSPKGNHRRMPMRKNVPASVKAPVKGVAPVNKGPVAKAPASAKPIIPNNKARVEPENKIVLPNGAVMPKAPVKPKITVSKGKAKTTKPKVTKSKKVTKKKTPKAKTK